VVVLIAFGRGPVTLAQSGAPSEGGTEPNVDLVEPPSSAALIGCETPREPEPLVLHVPVGASMKASAMPVPALAKPTLKIGMTDEPSTTFRVTVVGMVPARPRALVPLYAGFVCLESADSFFTLLGIRRGAVELNPIAARATGSTIKFLGLKAASSAATIHFIERDRKEHPKRAWLTMAAINGAMSWVVWHDMTVARRLRPQ
jgi:hypothetical protein